MRDKCTLFCFCHFHHHHTDIVMQQTLFQGGMNMGKGKHISTSSLQKICKALDCNIEDIVEFVKDEDPEE